MLFDAWCIADTDLAVMLQRLNLMRDKAQQTVADGHDLIGEMSAVHLRSGAGQIWAA